MKGRITFEVFKGKNKEHFWRVKSHNGKVIAVGGEGFKRPSGAKKSLKQFIVMIERGLFDIEGEQGEVK